MSRVSGYRVYEKDGHMYVDMSQDLTPVQEAFYNFSQEVTRVYSEVLSYIHDIGRERTDGKDGDMVTV